MSLSVGRAKVIGALKDLKLRWEKVRMSWDDEMSRNIEETFVEPMEPKVRAAVTAMERMGEMISRARRDCG